MMITIGLESPKFAANIGMIMRLAVNFGVQAVFYTGSRYKDHPADTPKGTRTIPLIHVETLGDACPHGATMIGIELDRTRSKNILYTLHPRSVMYCFGPEDGSLSPEVMTLCDQVWEIPSTYCLNLANSVAITLYDRIVKTATRNPIESEILAHLL